MATAARDAAGVVDQVVAGGALAGCGGLMISLVKVVAELRGSKELFQKLIDRLKAVMPLLERMLLNDKIKAVKPYLVGYETLLQDVLGSLEEHTNLNAVHRVLNHWKMKDCVIEFEARLSDIKESLDLATVEENANNHGEVMDRLDQLRQFTEQSNRDTVANMRVLQTEILLAGPEAYLKKLGNDRDVTLADFKHESANKLMIYYTKEQREQFRKIYKVMAPSLPEDLPRWHLPRNAYRFNKQSPFAAGEFRSIYHGTLVFSGAEVTIRTVDVQVGAYRTQEDFRKEVEKWEKLRDPHVLPFYGANDRNLPMVIVCGRAEHGNFNDYLSTHKHRFWQVFLDAARGLAYLHSQRICHGNLKCNNLLVTKHGVGVVSDFLFSFVRANSLLSLKEQTPDHFWKAPECFAPLQSAQGERPKSTNARPESDVYSLGMCLYEAMSGMAPYSEFDKEVAIEKIRHGELPSRPNGKIYDDAWNLIEEMCRHDFQDRIPLCDAIEEMRLLADTEKLKASHAPCYCATKACVECGGYRNIEASKRVP